MVFLKWQSGEQHQFGLFKIQIQTLENNNLGKKKQSRSLGIMKEQTVKTESCREDEKMDNFWEKGTEPSSLFPPPDSAEARWALVAPGSSRKKRQQPGPAYFLCAGIVRGFPSTGCSWREIPEQPPSVSLKRVQGWAPFQERSKYLNLGLSTAARWLHFTVSSVTFPQWLGESQLQETAVDRKLIGKRPPEGFELQPRKTQCLPLVARGQAWLLVARGLKVLALSICALAILSTSRADLGSDCLSYLCVREGNQHSRTYEAQRKHS